MITINLYLSVHCTISGTCRRARPFGKHSPMKWHADVNIRQRRGLSKLSRVFFLFPYTPAWLRLQRLRITRAHTAPLDRRTQRNFMTLYSPITVLEGVDVSTWDVELVG